MGDWDFIVVLAARILIGMNTHKTGMRTVLAAAAAGALVLGSAGGAIAEPGKAKGPQASASAEMTKLQNVNIKRHKKIDLADVTETSALNLRAKVRYSEKVMWDAASVQELGMTLAVYTKKVNGEMVVVDELDPLSPLTTESSPATPVMIKEKKKERKNHYYAGSAVISEVWNADQLGVLADEVADNGKAYICISSVTGEFSKFSQQTRMLLGVKADQETPTKKTVRDCVKVVNSATDSTSDGEQAS